MNNCGLYSILIKSLIHIFFFVFLTWCQNLYDLGKNQLPNIEGRPYAAHLNKCFTFHNFTILASFRWSFSSISPILVLIPTAPCPVLIIVPRYHASFPVLLPVALWLVCNFSSGIAPLFPWPFWQHSLYLANIPTISPAPYLTRFQQLPASFPTTVPATIIAILQYIH